MRWDTFQLNLPSSFLILHLKADKIKTFDYLVV